MERDMNVNIEKNSKENTTKFEKTRPAFFPVSEQKIRVLLILIMFSCHWPVTVNLCPLYGLTENRKRIERF